MLMANVIHGMVCVALEEKVEAVARRSAGGTGDSDSEKDRHPWLLSS
jgi:hypothetical protein